MIVFDRKEKEIKVPEGLGNINLTVVDANLEDKTVEINEVETTILPSSGYNGMSSLQIDAQPVYDNGYNEGETVQKAKLTGITITENGTYSREDGYNEITVDVPDLNGDYNEGYDAGKVDGYDSGYTAGIDYASENAEEIAAANAIDLVATEPGTYYTKYSDNIVNPNPVTGIYPDGETLHNSAQLINNKYNTGLIPTTNTKLEIWFKPELAQKGYIIGTQKPSKADSVFKMFFNKDTGKIETELAGKRVDLQNIGKQWYYLEMSFADGLWANGVKIGDYTANISGTYNIPFGINFLNDVPDESSQSNGNFGMIKITTDGITNVIIPTEDGFKNITTDEMLEVVYNEGTYKYIINEPIILDNLIKSVDVQPKIDVDKYGVKLAYSSFAEVPEIFDFSNVKDYSYMFHNCSSLLTTPLIDFKNATTMKDAFSSCRSLKIIPNWDLSNVEDSSYIFQECGSLIEIGNLNLEKARTLHHFLFYSWDDRPLEKIGVLNVPNVENLNEFFYYNFSPKTVPNLTEMGGFVGLKCNWNGGNGLDSCPNLTYQSCLNILNGLADVTELGGRTLKVHQNFLTTVGDEINIGINKGWTITA